MKKARIFIGIDVSKLTLDVCFNNETRVIRNTKIAITRFLNQIVKNNEYSELHVCIENTGKYSWKLMGIIPAYNITFYVVNPLHLKRSLGLIRGKNDKIDAERITGFIKKNYEETPSYIVERKCVKQLKTLISERKYKVSKCKELKTKNKDIKEVLDPNLRREITEDNDTLIELLTKQIKRIELQIQEIIKQDEELNKTFKILRSIPGVGLILSVYFIVKTNEFKSINSPRKLACFCGVAPFENRSGTSVFGKTRVSILADKTLKKTLHMGAMRSIQLDNDLKKYYDRKVKEGKNKMSIINAVRNKIIHIAFALIKNQDLYKNRLATS
jgi:transposase